MADKHPYVSGPGAITATINQFKKAFPSKVTAETLTKLGIAPNNESYVINVLRFLGAIDADGVRTQEAAEAFSKHAADDFAKAFGNLVKKAYSDLFSLHGDAAWTLDPDKLISFFRASDQTSDVVGRRQASTYQVLASFAGYQSTQPPKAAQVSQKAPAAKAKKTAKTPAVQQNPDVKVLPGAGSKPGGHDFGLTVRIEINLPAGGDQDTYDRIFRSIRENLIDAK